MYCTNRLKTSWGHNTSHLSSHTTQYVHLFEDPVDTPAAVEVETREEKKERRKKEKTEQVAYKLEQFPSTQLENQRTSRAFKLTG